MPSSPRAFISYSWTTVEHEQWVLRLATELTESGVDVVIDKWDLREGDDSIAFMERMVTDPSVTKVIMICDKSYAAKADARLSGVGTETQIISAKIYQSQTQSKFVAVIAEKDENGKAYVPAYYNARIYIDLSESESYAEGFEKLLRWTFDKPLFVKPLIGRPPSFVSDSAALSLGTSVAAKRVIEGVRHDRPSAQGAFTEYLSLFSENVERFRLTDEAAASDDAIFKSIGDFVPARNEFVGVVVTIIRYARELTYTAALNKFFESLLPYYIRPDSNTSWPPTGADNFKFVVHELYLYTIAILLREGKFDAADAMLSYSNYVPASPDHGSARTVGFTAFRQFVPSLEQRNQRLKLGRMSLRADILEQQSKASGVQFAHLMQADFVLFLRSRFRDKSRGWWPETLVFAEHQYGAFEIFARASSRTYLFGLLNLLCVSDLEDIKTKVNDLLSSQELPRWDHRTFDITLLIGMDDLGRKF